MSEKFVYLRGAFGEIQLTIYFLKRGVFPATFSPLARAESTRLIADNCKNPFRRSLMREKTSAPAGPLPKGEGD